ncbi:hypothetical protein J1N35_025672 [Gossypium stocksii]|uniref:Uncharacterized protein n=1 Tax=Gossypium stocksii TaxID=47602 RepID=A0A9D3V734_9ROSI|nr:hypothetical protein J1N35_025672 [Gossypium stocksii]
MNSEQKPDTLIKENMLKHMGFFAELDDNRTELDVNTQIEIVFKSLTKEFGEQKDMGKKKPTKCSVQPRRDRKKAKKLKDPKNIKCFFYNIKGHFRSNCKECLDYLVERGKGV